MGTVPTISINKTDGCQVFLSQDSLNCEIISAKGSEMNIVVPDKDGEFVSIHRSAGGMDAGGGFRSRLDGGWGRGVGFLR